MLYLIESGDYYKIGYSINVKNRMHSYSTNNPNYKLLDQCIGNETTERLLHEKLKHLRVKGEWFQKDPEVLSVWGFYKVICCEVSKSEEVLNSISDIIKNLKKEISSHIKTITKQEEEISELKSQLSQSLDINGKRLNKIDESYSEIKEEINNIQNKVKQSNTYKSVLNDVLDIAIKRLSEEEIVSIEQKNNVRIIRDRI